MSGAYNKGIHVCWPLNPCSPINAAGLVVATEIAAAIWKSLTHSEQTTCGACISSLKKTTTPTVPPSSLYVPYSPTKSQITWNFLGWSPITWPYHPEKKNSSAKSQWLECCPTSSKRWHQCKRPADPLWWTGQKPGPKACPACPMGSTVPSLREGATAQGSVEIGSGRSKPKFNELQIDWNPRNS